MTSDISPLSAPAPALVSTPAEITAEIRSFCRTITKNEPFFVKVEPRTSALPGECFSNVKKVIASEGGEQIFGWTIWAKPGVFAEAENHCVLRNSAGEYVDITGTLDGEPQVLFLPDTSATPVGGIGRNNRRKALNNDPLIKRFVSLGNAIGHATITLKLGGKLDNKIRKKVMESMHVNEAVLKKYGSFPVTFGEGQSANE